MVERVENPRPVVMLLMEYEFRGMMGREGTAWAEPTDPDSLPLLLLLLHCPLFDVVGELCRRHSKQNNQSG